MTETGEQIVARLRAKHGLDKRKVMTSKVDIVLGIAFFVVLVLTFGAVIGMIYSGIKMQQRCEARGGEVINVGRGSLCVSDDGRIIRRQRD